MFQSATLNVSLLAAHTDTGEPDVGESHDCRVTAREKKLIIVQLNDFGLAKLRKLGRNPTKRENE